MAAARKQSSGDTQPAALTPSAARPGLRRLTVVDDGGEEVIQAVQAGVEREQEDDGDLEPLEP